MTYLSKELLQELEKFFIVAKEYNALTGENANMPTCVVDECWHELGENKEQYNSFTAQAIDAEIEHLENKGHGLIEWVSLYEAKFGQLNDLWFTTAEGDFNSEASSHYKKTGELLMSWDCSPAIKPKPKPLTPGLRVVAV